MLVLLLTLLLSINDLNLWKLYDLKKSKPKPTLEISQISE